MTLPKPLLTLMDADLPAGVYIPNAWMIATIPAILISAVVGQIAAPEDLALQQEAVAPETMPFAAIVVSVLFLAPLLETAMMVGIFAASRAAGASPALQVGIQVAFWALLHGYIATPWAFAPAWLFFVFSCVWMTQRAISAARAFWMTAAVHGLNNLVGVMAIGAERFSS